MERKFPRPIKRIVVKLGSSVIATYAMQPKTAHLQSLVKEIATLPKDIQIVIVSSGAIVLGMGEMNQKNRPKDLASLQALASVGQTVLMKKYEEFFKGAGRKCAQVLMTWDDFSDRKRYNTVRSAFERMFEWGLIPVVNENDAIATDEIKFGDNDKLSALVACLTQADLLLILSDVEGFYDLKGSGQLFREIKEITKEIEGLASGTANKQMSRGGMITKLQAIKMATQANIPCVIAHGETPQVLSRILKGERIGTFFIEKEEKLLARKHWISFGAKPKGVLMVDDGAKEALLKGGHSLLLPGIVKWQGEFIQDDTVIIQDKNAAEIARGIINYSKDELMNIKDRRRKREAIHCDNLVLS